jgi:hypothetical protein
MSSKPIPDDEQPEVDDGTLSEVVRRPTRTAGDLSEVAEATAGSRRKTLLAILKPSPLGREFQPSGSCSRNYFGECGGLRSTSELRVRVLTTRLRCQRTDRCPVRRSVAEPQKQLPRQSRTDKEMRRMERYIDEISGFIRLTLEQRTTGICERSSRTGDRHRRARRQARCSAWLDPVDVELAGTDQDRIQGRHAQTRNPSTDRADTVAQAVSRRRLQRPSMCRATSAKALPGI